MVSCALLVLFIICNSVSVLLITPDAYSNTGMAWLFIALTQFLELSLALKMNVNLALMLFIAISLILLCSTLFLSKLFISGFFHN